MPPAILQEEARKKRVNEKEAKKVEACLRAEKESVFLNGQFVSFPYRTSKEKKREGISNKKGLRFTLYYSLLWLLMMFMLIVVGSNE